MDCKHEHWWLEHCVKCSSTEEMKYYLFIPWKSINIFKAKRRGIFIPVPYMVSCLSLMKWEQLEFTMPSFIHSYTSPLKLSSSLNSIQSHKIPSARNRSGKAASKVWIKPVEKPCCRTVMWGREMVTQVKFHWSNTWVQSSVVCIFPVINGVPVGRSSPWGVVIFGYCAFCGDSM